MISEMPCAAAPSSAKREKPLYNIRYLIDYTLNADFWVLTTYRVSGDRLAARTPGLEAVYMMKGSRR